MGDLDTKNHRAASTHRGITLVEFLTVMVIISIVVGLPMVTMLKERKQMTLEEGQATVINALNMARSRAIAGAGGTDFTMHVACIRENEIEIFPATSTIVCLKDTGGTTYSLPLGVKAGTTSVSFSRILGTSTETEITLNGFGATSTTTVSEYGFIQ